MRVYKISPINPQGCESTAPEALQMRIQQITSQVVCGESYFGKWYASDSRLCFDGDPINRYLQHDGDWGNTAQYFDSEQSLRQALEAGQRKGCRPDFTLSELEMENRAMIRSLLCSLLNDSEIHAERMRQTKEIDEDFEGEDGSRLA